MKITAEEEWWSSLSSLSYHLGLLFDRLLYRCWQEPLFALWWYSFELLFDQKGQWFAYYLLQWEA